MPILDKLNKKLDEAGVEEHGRTIEEAVDLLPVGGGEGGMKFKPEFVYGGPTTSLPMQWPGGGGGYGVVSKLIECEDTADGKKCFYGSLTLSISGAPHNFTLSEAHNFLKSDFAYNMFVFDSTQINGVVGFAVVSGAPIQPIFVEISGNILKFGAPIENCTGFKITIPLLKFVEK